MRKGKLFGLPAMMMMMMAASPLIIFGKNITEETTKWMAGLDIQREALA
jgi:hypothetical protein